MGYLFRKGLLVCLLVAGLTACATESTYAPVTDISNIESIPRSGIHYAQSGETLYEIAWRYGLDYRTLSRINRIQPPYTLYVARPVYLRYSAIPQKKTVYNVPQTAPVAVMPVSVVAPDIEPSAPVRQWIWPVQESVVKNFSPHNKGIDIPGRSGLPILASASGKVVYCGDGLRGYGKLIIIKHNSVYLSAYAHNSRLFVKEGEWVKQGQKIAEMGNTGSRLTMLHFEIRRAGKPINPMTLLSA
jgi:lipoprotein NlpD